MTPWQACRSGCGSSRQRYKIDLPCRTIHDPAVLGGQVVLIAAWPGGNPSPASAFTQIWSITDPDSRRYVLGNCFAEVGDWITLKAGEQADMEVIFGEINGTIFSSMLCVEVKGKEYPKNPYLGGPKLPMFKTEEPTLTMAEDIWNRLDPG